MPDIKAFLWPDSVAIVGASPNAEILRGRIMKVITSHPFKGEIYPVSRSHEEVFGRKAYASVGEIPGGADMAVLIIPAEFVPDALVECGEAGIKAVQIITSGFAEEAGAEGDEMQQRVREIAATYQMAVCGPNAEGFANTLADICPTFSPAVDEPDMPLVPEWRKSGHIGVIAQSGGVGFAFYDRGRPKELPFSYVVTTGNEACLEIVDFIDYMLDEDRTDVFIAFLEDVKDPAKFAPVAEKALRAGKPIIVTKIGRSEAGERAALSHTAALTGSYAGYRAMFERYGIIEGYDIEEIVDIAAGFSFWRDKLPRGRRVAITTGSGGAGGWMADLCIDAGLEVPELDPAARARIDEHLPPYGTSQNPVDGTAQIVRVVGYAALAEMAGSAGNVDAVVAICSARNTATFERDQENLARVAAEAEKPIVFCSYTMPRPRTTEIMSRAGFPLYTNFRNCARAVRLMADYRVRREAFLAAPRIESGAAKGRKAAAKHLAEAGSVLPEHTAREVLAAYGLPIEAGVLAENAEDAVKIAAKFDRSVVLKVQSPDILHMTEAGAVALNLEGEDEVRAAHDELLASARAYAPDADIDGVLVQAMARSGQEVILGISRDKAFGPMLTVGLGGIHVEVLGDVATAPAPLGEGEARALLARLKGAKLLEGVRGAAPADTSALVDLMVGLSRFAADFADEIAEIDLNPVLVHEAGLTVADALIVKRGGG